jgi:hypothetical protein
MSIREKSKKAIALYMLAAAMGKGLAAFSEQGGRSYQITPTIKTKDIYRFYSDGTWSHKRKKGVVFECTAWDEQEAQQKYEKFIFENQK